jgi:hypothetical protein
MCVASSNISHLNRTLIIRSKSFHVKYGNGRNYFVTNSLRFWRAEVGNAQFKKNWKWPILLLEKLTSSSCNKLRIPTKRPFKWLPVKRHCHLDVLTQFLRRKSGQFYYVYFILSTLFRQLYFVDFISSTLFRRLYFVDFISSTLFRRLYLVNFISSTF